MDPCCLELTKDVRDYPKRGNLVGNAAALEVMVRRTPLTVGAPGPTRIAWLRLAHTRHPLTHHAPSPAEPRPRDGAVSPSSRRSECPSSSMLAMARRRAAIVTRWRGACTHSRTS